jgi:hypothetical protein
MLLLHFGIHKLHQGCRKSHAKIAFNLRPAVRKKIICRVATSRKQIPIDFIYGACDWRPRWYNLFMANTWGTICMKLAASRMYFLHALAASTVQSREFFESTLPIILIKNKEATNKPEKLRDTCLCNNVWPRSNLVRRFL